MTQSIINEAQTRAPFIPVRRLGRELGDCNDYGSEIGEDWSAPIRRHAGAGIEEAMTHDRRWPICSGNTPSNVALWT